jgi:hypothetical protein
MGKAEKTTSEFERFKNLAANLISVSNVEVRKKIEDEKRRKKSTRRRSSTRRKSTAAPK